MFRDFVSSKSHSMQQKFQHVFDNPFIVESRRNRMEDPLYDAFSNFLEMNDTKDISKEFTHEFFNRSQEAWRSNKKPKGVGWVYRCTYFHSYYGKDPKKWGQRCKKAIYSPNRLNVDFGGTLNITNLNSKRCKQHMNRKDRSN